VRHGLRRGAREGRSGSSRRRRRRRCRLSRGLRAVAGAVGRRKGRRHGRMRRRHGRVGCTYALEIARARLVWHRGRRTVVYERAQLGRAPAERVASGGVGLARKVKSCERPVRAKRVAERGSARVGDAARRQSQPHEGIGLLEKRSKVRRARIAHVVAAQVEVPGWLTRELDGNGQLPCSTRPDARGTQGEAVVHQGALEGVLEARTTLLRRRKAQVLAPRVEDPLGARDRRGVPVPRLWAGR
jgi:hypothetical protein